MTARPGAPELIGMPRNQWSTRPKDEKSLLASKLFDGQLYDGRKYKHQQCKKCYSIFLKRVIEHNCVNIQEQGLEEPFELLKTELRLFVNS